MASTKPTEQEYTAAMQRHGTDAWTADDQRTAERWLATRTGDSSTEDEAATVAEVAVNADKPTRGR